MSVSSGLMLFVISRRLSNAEAMLRPDWLGGGGEAEQAKWRRKEDDSCVSMVELGENQWISAGEKALYALVSLKREYG